MPTYDEIAPIVEDLVRIKSKKFTRGFLAQDDIAQEIRIKCYSSIGSYNPAKGQSIKTFLNVCTENHLINLMRDKFAKFNPPCKNRGCKHYEATGIPTEEAKSCPSFMKYVSKYVRKCAVRMPTAIEEFWNEDKSSSMFNDKTFEWTDINLSIMEIFKSDFPKDFDRLYILYQDMMEGKEVSAKDKESIQSVVAKVLEI